MKVNKENRIKTVDGQNVEIVYVLSDDRDIVCFNYNGKGKSFVKPSAYIVAKIESGEWIEY